MRNEDYEGRLSGFEEYNFTIWQEVGITGPNGIVMGAKKGKDWALFVDLASLGFIELYFKVDQKVVTFLCKKLGYDLAINFGGVAGIERYSNLTNKIFSEYYNGKDFNVITLIFCEYYRYSPDYGKCFLEMTQSDDDLESPFREAVLQLSCSCWDGFYITSKGKSKCRSYPKKQKTACQ